MSSDTPAATPDEIEQATAAHLEIMEAVNNLSRDKFPATIIMAGLATACADVITCTVGADQVPKWFAEQALAANELLRTGG